MLRLSLPRLDERGCGATVTCVGLIRADPAPVPVIESLAAQGSFFCEVSFRPRRRCLPRRLLAQAALSLGKHVGPTHTKRVRKRDNMIHTHGSFSGKYPRDLSLGHA